MKKTLLILLSAIIVFIGGFLIYLKIVKPLIIKPYAALSVHCQNCQATVFLDGKKLGTTPLKLDKVSSGGAKILLSDGTNTYEDEITLTAKTRTVVSRDLGPSEVFSAGDIIWLEKSDIGETISVLTNPIEAAVKLDGKELGKSPVTTETLSEDEHTIEVAKENYEGRGAKVRITKGYKINMSFQLFPIPTPKSPSEIKLTEEEQAFKIFDLSTQSPILFSDPASWAKAVSHWAATRQKDLKVNFFVDFAGKIYDAKGEVFLPKEKVDLKEKTIAYLGKTEDKGLTEVAKAAIKNLETGTKPKSSEPGKGKQVEILETGTGWLRVREEPSLSGAEITKVNVGEKFTVLEEKEGWYKISLPDGKSGWISGQYAKKISP